MPSAKKMAACDEDASPEAVVTFLDAALEKYGKHSVLYVSIYDVLQSTCPNLCFKISFGTVFWTTQPEKLWAVIEALIETVTPFVSVMSSTDWPLPQSKET